MLTGKVHCDGTVTIGRVPPEKKGAEEKRDDRLRFPDVEVEWQESFGTEGGVARLKYSDPDLNERAISDHQSRLDPPQELCQSKKRYGLKGITSHGKQSVKSGAAYLERKYGRERLGLLTLTLPSERQGFTEETLERIATNWGDIQRRLGKELERELARVNAPPEFCLVSEVQEKRFNNEGLPVPHFHLCYVASQSKGKSNWYITADRFREIWGRIVSGYLPSSESQWQGGVDCQRIKKSASGYLAKYMSKGGKVVARIREEGKEQWLPRQWWSLWGKLKAKIKAMIYPLNSIECQSIFYANDETLDSELKVWKRLYINAIDDHELCVGLWGRLTCQQYVWWTGISWDIT